MPVCPESACPHRRRTGRPAELVPGLERCPDCGTTLVAGLPPEEAPRPRPWPGDLRRRLAWTLGLAVALWLVSYLPMLGLPTLPGLDLEGLEALAGGPWRMDAIARGALSLGPTPFLVGFVLVELFALVLPRFRVRRREDPAFRRRLTRAGLGLGLAWALARGYGTAWQLEGLAWSLPELVAEPGLRFRLATALVLAAGACVWACAAWLVERHGVGRGFAVVLLVDLLSDLPWGLWGLGRQFALELIAPLQAAILGAGVIGTLWTLSRLWSLGERLAGTLPVRLPASGTLPLETGLALALLPSLLATFLEGGWLETFAVAVAPGSPGHLALMLGGILLLVPPASAWFHWRHRQAWRQGEARRTWLRARAWSALFLAGLVLADLGLRRLLGPGGEALWPGALALLVVWALGADWLEEVRARREAGQIGLAPLAAFQDATDALRARTAAGPGAVLTGLRFRALSYFFAPYAPLVLWAPRPARDRPGAAP